MPIRPPRHAAALLLAVVGAQALSAGMIDVPGDRGHVFRIDADSITRDGDRVTYRLVGQGTYRQDDYDGRIEVDCVRRQRHELSASFNSLNILVGHNTNAGGTQMYDVLPDTRPANELAIVCARVGLAPPAATTVPPVSDPGRPPGLPPGAYATPRPASSLTTALRDPIDVGDDAGHSYQVEGASITRLGDFVRYRLVGHGKAAQDDYDGLVEANCAYRRRRELGANVDGETGGVRHNPGEVQSFDVTPGTRVARELDLVCARVANTTAPTTISTTSTSTTITVPTNGTSGRIAIQVPPVTPVPSSSPTWTGQRPTTPARPPAPAFAPGMRDAAAGALLDANGVVAVPHSFAAGCEHVDALADGRLFHTTILLDDATANATLLRLTNAQRAPDGSRDANDVIVPAVPFALRLAGVRAAEPATFLRVEGSALRNAAAVLHSAGTDAPADTGNGIGHDAGSGAGAMTIAVSTTGPVATGIVVDAHGSLAGLAVAADAADGTRPAGFVSADALRDLLRRAGVAWRADTGTRPIAPAAALRAATSGAVVLACYAAR